jgi:hypothetical protein
MQEVFSKAEKPGEARACGVRSRRATSIHIETDDLEATRQGVSAYQKHALVPHEAYQALYASGEAFSRPSFAGFTVHVDIRAMQVISEV